jgi:hypothetical protein
VCLWLCVSVYVSVCLCVCVCVHVFVLCFARILYMQVSRAAKRAHANEFGVFESVQLFGGTFLPS